MLDWADVEKLKVGDVVYCEQRVGNYITFSFAIVRVLKEDTLLLDTGEGVLFLSKAQFPVDNLYLDE